MVTQSQKNIVDIMIEIDMHAVMCYEFFFT